MRNQDHLLEAIINVTHNERRYQRYDLMNELCGKERIAELRRHFSVKEVINAFNEARAENQGFEPALAEYSYSDKKYFQEAEGYKKADYAAVYQSLKTLIKKGIVSHATTRVWHNNKISLFTLNDARAIAKADGKIRVRRKALNVELAWTTEGGYHNLNGYYKNVVVRVEGRDAGRITHYRYDKRGYWFEPFTRDSNVYGWQTRKLGSMEAIMKNLRRGNWREK